jgi:predicted secreted protein
MNQSQAISGIKTLFRRWNPSTSQFENIAEINSIEGPSMSRETIDVTTLDTTDGYRRFIAALRDPGDVTLSMNFRRDTYDKMKQDFESDTPGVYEIVLPDDDMTSLEFEGLVTELPLAINVDDKITSDVVIKISGKVEVESGSGS